MGRKKSYETEGITVHYEPGLCIHAAECVHRLPDVFDPKRRPWIEPSQAGPDALAHVIERCPTGALTYDVHASESPDKEASVHLAPNGPIFARGKIEVTHCDGTVTEMTRVALCRCGHSENKPFCDNSHVASDFRG